MQTPIASMLALQDKMNTRVHPDWRAQQHAWYRAIWVECAELMDHYGWKWWKKQTPDWPQVQLELIDIWHFGLSDCLQYRDADVLVDEIAELFAAEPAPGDFRTVLEEFVASVTATQRFDGPRFVQLMAAAGLSFAELYRGYIGKNVLNFFRQDHGYQDGSYRKLWQGREDNEHLAELAQTLDSARADYQQALYQLLAERYHATSDSGAGQ